MYLLIIWYKTSSILIMIFVTDWLQKYIRLIISFNIFAFLKKSVQSLQYCQVYIWCIFVCHMMRIRRRIRSISIKLFPVKLEKEKKTLNGFKQNASNKQSRYLINNYFLNVSSSSLGFVKELFTPLAHYLTVLLT